MLNWLDKFHRTRWGFLAFAVVELLLAYLFVSWAIDSGSIWDYLITLVFFVAFLQNVVKLIGALLFPRRRLAKHQPRPQPAAQRNKRVK